MLSWRPLLRGHTVLGGQRQIDQVKCVFFSLKGAAGVEGQIQIGLFRQRIWNEPDFVEEGEMKPVCVRKKTERLWTKTRLSSGDVRSRDWGTGAFACVFCLLKTQTAFCDVLKALLHQSFVNYLRRNRQLLLVKELTETSFKDVFKHVNKEIQSFEAAQQKLTDNSSLKWNRNSCLPLLDGGGSTSVSICVLSSPPACLQSISPMKPGRCAHGSSSDPQHKGGNELKWIKPDFYFLTVNVVFQNKIMNHTDIPAWRGLAAMLGWSEPEPEAAFMVLVTHRTNTWIPGR